MATTGCNAPGAAMLIGVRRPSYRLGSVVQTSIAEAGDRFPGQLPTAALNAHGNLSVQYTPELTRCDLLS